MAENEKDPFGDKLRDARRGKEDAFHEAEERKLIEQLRRSTTSALDSKVREAALHRCPQCGERLQSGHMHGVSVEFCPQQHGVWLSKQDLDEIVRHEDNGWIARWLKQEFPKR